MRYKRLTLSQLNECKYPNLVAEIIESGYSTRTLGYNMGLGKNHDEGDPEIWDKINGTDEMLVSHCIGLCHLFNCSFDYLFSNEIKVKNGMPEAYWRFYEWNKEEQEKEAGIYVISETLKQNPYLISFMKDAIEHIEKSDKPTEEVERITKLLHGDGSN